MITDEDNNWLAPIKREVYSRYQKIKATRARNKHFKIVTQLRAKIIKKLYQEHKEHSFTTIDTSYIDNVFDFESILCSCNLYIDITKKMLEDEYGKEFKIICAAT